MADPWGYLLNRSGQLALDVATTGPLLGELLIPLAAGAFVLWRLRGWRGAMWVATAATGPIVVAMHPVLDQYSRLVSPAWIVVVVAVGLLVDMVVARLLGGRVTASGVSTSH